MLLCRAEGTARIITVSNKKADSEKGEMLLHYKEFRGLRPPRNSFTILLTDVLIIYKEDKPP